MSKRCKYDFTNHEVSMETFKHLIITLKDYGRVICERKKREDETIGIKAFCWQGESIQHLLAKMPDGRVKNFITRLDRISDTVQEKSGTIAFKTFKRHFINDRFFEYADDDVPEVSAKGVLDYNPDYNEKEIDHVYGFDINSAYAFAMLKPMPNINKMAKNVKMTKIMDELGIGFKKTFETTTSRNPKPIYRFAHIGEKADFYFEKEQSPFIAYVDYYFGKRSHCKSKQEKRNCKDMLNFLVGYMQKKNPWYRAAIVEYCNQTIRNYIDKYQKYFVFSNTDSFYLRLPQGIPESILARVGDNLGELKIEMFDGLFRLKNNNYQTPDKIKYRGIPQGWFKKFKEIHKREFNILKDEIPNQGNLFVFKKGKFYEQV